MKITINVDASDRSSLHITTDDIDEGENPLPYLRKAVAALKWQVDAYPNCPIHRDGPAKKAYLDFIKDDVAYSSWDELPETTRNVWRGIAKK